MAASLDWRVCRLNHCLKNLPNLIDELFGGALSMSKFRAKNFMKVSWNRVTDKISEWETVHC